LHQFDLADRTDVRLDINTVPPIASRTRPGVLTVPLFSDGREDVRIERWSAGARISLAVPGGLEAFVLDGGFTEGHDEFLRHSWLRLPAGSLLDAVAGNDGAKLWIKTGHLAHLSTSITDKEEA
jgi:hypothetical protein